MGELRILAPCCFGCPMHTADDETDARWCNAVGRKIDDEASGGWPTWCPLLIGPVIVTAGRKDA